MRKPVLLLAVVALSASACSASTSTQAPGRAQGADHHLATRPPSEPDVPPPTPYDGVTYQDPGVNPFVPAERDRESTFALDVDTASYAIAQRFVEDGNLADDQFQNDEVDAGAIGAGHASTALYALRLTGEDGGLFNGGRVATVHLRWTDPQSREAEEVSGDVHLGDLAGSFADTAPAFQLDAIVAAAGERMRQSRWANDYDLRDVSALADEVADDLPRTDEVHALLAMLDEAGRLER